MINMDNYFSTINSIGVNKLTPALSKSHEAVLKITNNGESWEKYSASDGVKSFIDKYFRNLNVFIKTLIPTSGKADVKVVSQKAVKERKSRKSKEPPAEDDLPEPKSVARISEEVKFIKRFVGLHNKKKSPQTILSFIKSLQRSIVQKLIRKTSPFAKEIKSIQQALIDF